MAVNALHVKKCGEESAKLNDFIVEPEIVQAKASLAADTEHIKFVLHGSNLPICLFENS